MTYGERVVVGERGGGMMVMMLRGRLAVINTERIEWFVSLISDRVGTRGGSRREAHGLVCRLARLTRLTGGSGPQLTPHLHVLFGRLDIRHWISELNTLQLCRLRPSRNSWMQSRSKISWRRLYLIVSCNSTKLHKEHPTVLSTAQP